MSTRNDHEAPNREPPTDGSPYPRGNWWGEDNGDSGDDRAGHEEVAGTGYYEFVAKGILMHAGDVTRLDPEALLEEPGEGLPEEWAFHEQAGEAVPLSDPETYVPKQHERSDGTALNYRQHRHRHRVSKLSGREFFGGPIEDRPTPEFLDVVTDALDVADLPPSARRDIISRAEHLKRHRDDLHDTQIMTRVLRWIEDPNRLDS